MNAVKDGGKKLWNFLSLPIYQHKKIKSLIADGTNSEHLAYAFELVNNSGAAITVNILFNTLYCFYLSDIGIYQVYLFSNETSRFILKGYQKDTVIRKLCNYDLNLALSEQDYTKILNSFFITLSD